MGTIFQESFQNPSLFRGVFYFDNIKLRKWAKKLHSSGTGYQQYTLIDEIINDT